jgi:antitoxin ParD1/3/4
LINIPNIGIFVFKIKDMPKNTSVSLGEHFEQFIERCILSGRYSSASEVIRAGLRKLDEEEINIKKLRESIEIGEQSGYVKNFDPKRHLADLNRKLVK